MSKVYVSAMIEAATGSEKALAAVLADVVADVRAEKGCIRYDLHQCVEKPTRFMFYEIWESEGDLEAHGKTSHIARMRERMADLLAGPPEVLVHDAVDVAG